MREKKSPPAAGAGRVAVDPSRAVWSMTAIFRSVVSTTFCDSRPTTMPPIVRIGIRIKPIRKLLVLTAARYSRRAMT